MELPKCHQFWLRRLLTLCVVRYPVKKLNDNETKIEKEEKSQKRRVGKRITISKE